MLRVLCLATDPPKITQVHEVSEGYMHHYVYFIGLFVWNRCQLLRQACIRLQSSGACIILIWWFHFTGDAFFRTVP